MEVAWPAVVPHKTKPEAGQVGETFCSNCSSGLIRGSSRVTQLTLISSTTVSKKTIKHISMAAAVSEIYEPFLPKSLPSPPPSLEFCDPCGGLLAQMYKVHSRIKALSNPESKLIRFLKKNSVPKITCSGLGLHGQNDTDTDTRSVQELLDSVAAKLSQVSSSSSSSASVSVFEEDLTQGLPALGDIKTEAQDQEFIHASATESSEDDESASIEAESEPGSEFETTAKRKRASVSEPSCQIVEDSNQSSRFFRYSGSCPGPHCSEVFQNVLKADVKKHFRTVHGREAEFCFLCYICKTSVPVKGGQKVSHMKTHPGDVEGNLAELERNNSSVLRTKCGLFLTKDEITDKVRKYLRLRKRVRRKAKLSNSLLTHVCPHCNRVLKTPEYLKRHIQLLHRKVSNNICKICGKPMQSKGSLSLHMKTHMGPEERRKDLENGPGQESDNQWLCQECGKILSCQRSLQKHNRTHLPSESRRTFCQEPGCDYSAFTTTSLKRHLKLHANFLS